MAIKVDAWRAGKEGVIHYGRPTVKDTDGTQLYRIACMGRNIRYYVRAIADQSAPVTCQRCGRKGGR